MLPGIASNHDTPWQMELEASFPFIETPDQTAAARDVKTDMERDRPMDRLVVGDVGYGKTEVAVRAAFKAVGGGRQVAMLVPTTVLAQQHAATFAERMAAFPVRIEMLSRFRSHAEQRAILAGLAAGRVDIVIGTHRLLQADVAFKSLGLVIIDEEQRFGVGHKERLKQLRREVDVLTLSATPIPRTLHMAMSGIRDMSTIETPPEERLPITTYVMENDDQVVREAILRELERGGQAYFVHNRVRSIEGVQRWLRDLVPEARFLVGHGQMGEGQLEKVMTRFVAGDADVLVCTTIIESGLDIPNVNTIIIHQAQQLGLAQMYQLRGRVGRGAAQAYAYLLYDRSRPLSETAGKRLQTIFDATELGAGFQIALRDLEIRGTGNLLGAEQSGQIGAVGFELYTQLLSETVEQLRAKAEDRPPRPARRGPQVSVDLPLAAHIPPAYIEHLNTRLAAYQQIAAIETTEQVAAVREDLADRFGPLPRPLETLLRVVRLRTLAARLGATSLHRDGDRVVLQLAEGLTFDETARRLPLQTAPRSAAPAAPRHPPRPRRLAGGAGRSAAAPGPGPGGAARRPGRGPRRRLTPARRRLTPARRALYSGPVERAARDEPHHLPDHQHRPDRRPTREDLGSYSSTSIATRSGSSPPCASSSLPSARWGWAPPTASTAASAPSKARAPGASRPSTPPAMAPRRATTAKVRRRRRQNAHPRLHRPRADRQRHTPHPAPRPHPALVGHAPPRRHLAPLHAQQGQRRHGGDARQLPPSGHRVRLRTPPPAPRPAALASMTPAGVGAWRSPAAHLTGGQEVVGSNPTAPTTPLARSRRPPQALSPSPPRAPAWAAPTRASPARPNPPLPRRRLQRPYGPGSR